jgi:oligopeptide/dipeptide ABC transporter ATP-binding protein
MEDEILLKIEGLRTHFYTEAGIVKAVDNVSFDIKKGESLGLVGESGSGKTVLALSVLRIVPKPGKIIEGKIIFKDHNLLEYSEKEMQKIRGTEIAVIFQDPSSSLNPVYTVEAQLRDILMAHEQITKQDAHEKILELLNLVGIPEAEIRMKEFPHQFSGGMKQRVAIARALAMHPTLLFADEPTTSLDVTIQAQVLDLLENLKKELKMSMVMITHDMGIIAKMTTRVVVLYAGNVCEIAPTETLFENPRHPYTALLLAAVPRLDRKKTLTIIPGNIPNLIEPPSGCRFHPRCKYAVEECKQLIPNLVNSGPNQFVACHKWDKLNLTGGNV